jgi:molybdate transport system ATP-binding protein
VLDARIRKRLGSRDGRGPVIDVHFRAGDGITVLFGASGAGKTSILRTIAGIMDPDQGRISLGDTLFFDSASGVRMPMRKRRVGYVFQNHRLFPHLSALDNVLYGARGREGRSPRDRARELLSLLGIERTADRHPDQLSGGEQQRVALARALAADPAIMLLDEPLSAVDVATRSLLVEEIAQIQKTSGIPFVYVTHNHTEAIRLGRNMLVIDEGRIVQEGAPLEIFNAPRTAPVARVVGAENIFIGRVLGHHPEDGITSIELGSCRIEAAYCGLPPGSRVTLGIRSEDILVSRERITQTSARNVLEGVIHHIIRDMDRAELIVSCGVDFKVSVTPATVRILELEPGLRVYLLVKARALHLLA